MLGENLASQPLRPSALTSLSARTTFGVVLPQVETVRGPVAVESLGYTLMHEHLSSNLGMEYRGNGLINDVELVSDEVTAFARQSGHTIVDCSSVGLGRNPTSLAAISSNTGVNVVMGSGYYRDPYHDAKFINERSVDDLAETIVDDIEVGVNGTGVKAGIIGEVGCDKWYASAMEERTLRAAARAHLRTGVPITTHAARWPVGRVQLDIFEHEGVDPRGVIIGHCDWQVDAKQYHLDLARAGAFVQFDTIAHAMGDYDLDMTARYITNLIDAGFIDHVLMSHDLCLRNQFTAFGGPGYTFIHDAFRARLKGFGVEASAFDQITVQNPARALTPRGSTRDDH